jgi:hypothetical protein
MASSTPVREKAGWMTPDLVLWLNRVGLAVVAFAYLGTVPAAVVGAMSDPTLAPLTILGIKRNRGINPRLARDSAVS